MDILDDVDMSHKSPKSLDVQWQKSERWRNTSYITYMPEVKKKKSFFDEHLSLFRK